MGSAAVVRAKNRHDSASILNEELVEAGLVGDVDGRDMIEFPLGSGESVRILCDGNY